MNANQYSPVEIHGEVENQELVKIKTDLEKLKEKISKLRQKIDDDQELLGGLQTLLKIHIEDPTFFESLTFMQADVKLCLKIIEELLLPF